jgi:ElaB/YqjD/DUF883 family membrane-anchored ribosome-binding protein
MNTHLQDSLADKQAGLKVDASVIQDEINETLKRMEESFKASKAALTDTLEEGKLSVEKLLSQGRDTAEGYVYDARHQIRHNPVSSVAFALGVGAVVGVLLGWLAPRAGQRSNFR